MCLATFSQKMCYDLGLWFHRIVYVFFLCDVLISLPSSGKVIYISMHSSSEDGLLFCQGCSHAHSQNLFTLHRKQDIGNEIEKRVLDYPDEYNAISCVLTYWEVENDGSKCSWEILTGLYLWNLCFLYVVVYLTSICLLCWCFLSDSLFLITPFGKP